MKTVIRDIFLKQMLNVRKICLKKLRSIFTRIFYFYLKEIKFKKCNKLACKIQDKENYVVYIRALKQALNHGLIPKKVHRVIQFNQKAWIKPYIDMNTKLRTEAKNDFEKDFFKLMNNAAFRKTMENVREHRDIKQIEKEISQLQNLIIIQQNTFQKT